jgi:DNA-binding MarR family transcriptional regulator
MTAGRPGGSHTALLTEIVLLIFRVNGQLLASGNRLVASLALTSARWQMLGAVALSNRPRTAPQLAAQMGMTRQGAQKQLNLLVGEGLMTIEPNPNHARSPRYVLTRKGLSVYQATERVQTAWAARLAKGLGHTDLEATHRLLGLLTKRLSVTE